MKIMLANQRGFCAGVDRAIDIVERALELFGSPIYVRHAVVHNRYVVNSLKEKGAVFVEKLQEVPEHSVVIFSAHGVSKAVQAEAIKRKLQVYDAVCPLVTKVHMEVDHYQKDERECILIGHHGHPEVAGILGQYQTTKQGLTAHLVESEEDVQQLQVHNPNRLAYVTQTTLSVDDTANIIALLRQRFPNIAGPKKEDICYATQNRQDAVKQLAKQCDLILVIGSTSSSNAQRLLETACKAGVSSYLIDHAAEIKNAWLYDRQCVGVTAGASTPEILVQQVVQQLQASGGELIAAGLQKREAIIFHLPKALARGTSHPS